MTISDIKNLPVGAHLMLGREGLSEVTLADLEYLYVYHGAAGWLMIAWTPRRRYTGIGETLDAALNELKAKLRLC